MVELVDTPDLGSGGESRGSSSLPIPTKCEMNDGTNEKPYNIRTILFGGIQELLGTTAELID